MITKAEHEREELYLLLLPGKDQPMRFHAGAGLTPHGLSLRLTSAGGPFEWKNPDSLRFFFDDQEIPASTVIHQFADRGTPGVPVIRVEVKSQ